MSILFSLSRSYHSSNQIWRANIRFKDILIIWIYSVIYICIYIYGRKRYEYVAWSCFCLWRSWMSHTDWAAVAAVSARWRSWAFSVFFLTLYDRVLHIRLLLLIADIQVNKVDQAFSSFWSKITQPGRYDEAENVSLLKYVCIHLELTT